MTLRAPIRLRTVRAPRPTASSAAAAGAAAPVPATHDLISVRPPVLGLGRSASPAAGTVGLSGYPAPSYWVRRRREQERVLAALGALTQPREREVLAMPGSAADERELRR